jgi:uncharacterized protein YbgA (DUF1722 family)
MEGVPVHAARERPARRGRGVFAAVLLAAFPELPVEEEGRLVDPALRESWIERVFAYWRLRALLAGRFAPGRLAAFHAAHELQLMAHSPGAPRALGRIVAAARTHAPAELRARYARGFMQALARRATRARHASALRHAAGRLGAGLDAAGRAELEGSIRDYRAGRVPLVVPATLVRHHARRLGAAPLLGQVYLDPHPKELLLRYHV